VLKKNKKQKIAGRAGGHFAIVASKYNARYVDSMVQAAERCLTAAGAESIRIVRVPGAFEIPVVVSRLARRQAPPLAAIICLGVILRGETTHAQHIAEAVTQSLAQMQLETGIPVIHEVLLLENEAQAKVRCLSREHNRGTEAAQTAIEMRTVLRDLGREGG
jgi:6,7-dimethyl-8-ribityllumazine synthase